MSSESHSASPTVTRIIHQTWKSTTVPDAFVSFVESWKRHHPDWDYRLWTDEDNDAFIAEHYPWFLPTFRAYPSNIQRADAVRYFLLHHFGGLYVDLDFECLAPLDELLSDVECIVGSEPTIHARRLRDQPRAACNAIMASVKGHPFWEHVHASMKERFDKTPSSNPMATTGPVMLDDAVNSWTGNPVTVAAPDVFFPLPDLLSDKLGLKEKERAYFCNMRDTGSYPAATVAVHHWSHTWIGTQPVREAIAKVKQRLSTLGALARVELTADEALRPAHYKVTFPEAAFAAAEDKQATYADRVIRGQAVASASSVVFCFLLYNRLDLVPVVQARLRHLAEPFREARFVIYGADSTDGTREVLERWAQEEPDRVRLVDATVPKDENRIARIAHLRNALLNGVENEPTADFVVMLDGDLAGPISRDGLLHSICLMHARDIDAVSAFGINNYVGIKAPRAFVGYTYYDPFAYREHNRKRTESDFAIRRRLSGIRRGDEVIPVISGFAGLCVYRASSIRGLRYDTSGEDCEHVSFHAGLHDKGGNLVVNPALLLLAGKQGNHQRSRDDSRVSEHLFEDPKSPN